AAADTKYVSLFSPCGVRAIAVGAIGHAPRSRSSMSASMAGKEKRPLALARSKSFSKNPGPDLFSQGPTSRVSSALVGLTTVFGMGTGVTPPLEGPRRQLYSLLCCAFNAVGEVIVRRVLSLWTSPRLLSRAFC